MELKEVRNAQPLPAKSIVINVTCSTPVSADELVLKLKQLATHLNRGSAMANQALVSNRRLERCEHGLPTRRITLRMLRESGSFIIGSTDDECLHECDTPGDDQPVVPKRFDRLRLIAIGYESFFDDIEDESRLSMREAVLKQLLRHARFLFPNAELSLGEQDAMVWSPTRRKRTTPAWLQ